MIQKYLPWAPHKRNWMDVHFAWFSFILASQRWDKNGMKNQLNINNPNVVDEKNIHYTAPPCIYRSTPSPVFTFTFINSSRSSVNSLGPYMPLHWKTLCTKRIIHLITACSICNNSVPTFGTITVKHTSPL